ncbi:protein CURLY FLAG LEAF 1-like [Euphorbia lathyris]|uniref:protein CURLY FLAG LEAF 1-like n=1 Tax=Euphorbia lathyris TaxID=212925 RepID=UPI003313AC7D
MEITELSLAPRRKFGNNTYSSSSESENNFSGNRKRKFLEQQPSVDLHVKDPLPIDWEQCLDLESGRMYYLNRKTLRKSWKWPNKDQKLDLELHISVPPAPPYEHNHHHHQDKKQLMMSSPSSTSSSCSSNNNMVALACLNCHLLVILSKSSPSCPNCKYVHSLPLMSHHQPPPLPKLSPSKSLHTLSLLD